MPGAGRGKQARGNAVQILGIETSCDETAAAVVVGGQRVRSNIVASQIARHQAYGGVVPELAARAHITAIMPVVESALDEAGVGRDQIDAVAVTEGPGLAGALLVGVNVAKAFAYALDRPLIGVNHLEAHIYANWLSLPGAAPPPAPPFPLICLLVSGGHTELILMTGHGQYRHLGRTLDDAAGEAFDKGARLLGLGYPGGPAIQQAATGGDASRFDLPRAWLGDSDDFSFSGLKTALVRLLEPWRLPEPAAPGQPAGTPAGPFREHRPPRYRDDLPVADLAAAFQEAIVEPLAIKTIRAARAHGARSLLLAGGVAANAALRARVRALAVAELGDDVLLRVPPLIYCTDNAAMIAGAACYAMRRGAQAGWELDVRPRMPLGS
ncbi:MAG: tRNA (adenosine(37)-N6)-threonylcarbamoyltransferase complex transferase subunit TsaD [Thermomicrobiales bacterium]|nr:tRNA (adenosine(37)-N6)-threonylcarbamoyltransferase complex transferase subunit TsaD [Thermomicrobiales bacterium]